MRVLLIEDDDGTAQSIGLMLKSENFNVYTTDLGEEGVDLGKLYDYDIISLDLNLPDMSGFEVLRSLRVSKMQELRFSSYPGSLASRTGSRASALAPTTMWSSRSTKTNWSRVSMQSSAALRATRSRWSRLATGQRVPDAGTPEHSQGQERGAPPCIRHRLFPRTGPATQGLPTPRARRHRSIRQVIGRHLFVCVTQPAHAPLRQ